MTEFNPFDTSNVALPLSDAPPKKKKGRPAGTGKTKVARKAASKPAAPLAAFKIDLSIALAALPGLKPEEVKLFGGILQTLSILPKDSRARLLEAINKAFA